jgi:parvulin-like peptidyl-prolyl isomerase
VPNDFEATQMHVVAAMFGDDFAAAVANIPPGTWAGPIPSGYGQHLVLIRARIPGTPPRLAAIHDAVLREWQNAHREDANNAAYRQMRAKYVIRVDMPNSITATP